MNWLFNPYITIWNGVMTSIVGYPKYHRSTHHWMVEYHYCYVSSAEVCRLFSVSQVPLEILAPLRCCNSRSPAESGLRRHLGTLVHWNKRELWDLLQLCWSKMKSFVSIKIDLNENQKYQAFLVTCRFYRL